MTFTSSKPVETVALHMHQSVVKPMENMERRPIQNGMMEPYIYIYIYIHYGNIFQCPSHD
ncbi:MAG: hypothetical protein WKF36_11885 [Candidatus Nitrosocosmicus sp.]